MSSRTKRPLEATELVGSMQPGSTRDDDALTRDHGAPTLREMAGRSSRAKRKPGSERSTRGHARRCRGGRRGRWKRRSPRSASSPGARGTPTRDQGEEERGEGEPSCHPCGGASRSPCRGRARRCCARRGRRKRDDVVHWATCRRSFTTQSRVRGDDTTQPRAAPWHILTNDVFRDTINGAEVTRKILPLNLSCSRCCQASGRSRAGVVRRPKFSSGSYASSGAAREDVVDDDERWRDAARLGGTSSPCSIMEDDCSAHTVRRKVQPFHL